MSYSVKAFYPGEPAPRVETFETLEQAEAKFNEHAKPITGCTAAYVYIGEVVRCHWAVGYNDVYADSPDDDDDYYNERDIDFDADDDNPFSDCGLFEDSGVYVCATVGSEDCEFDCKFNSWIGKAAQGDDEDLDEAEAPAPAEGDAR